ncbi:MAG TPA: antibiotic biosynthesis monooxygenase [Cytophagales bacterium]|nr:antibiotic biosynthesis monooxygenase [Cytophagales bacterium]
MDHQNAIAVIFEVEPTSGKKQAYLDLAAELKSELVTIPGFISIERFQSLTHPEKVLSLSFWESEDAIRQWRNLTMHRSAQAQGRAGIFKDYRLRVAQVLRDYGMHDRAEAPGDSRSVHDGKS